MNIEELRKLKSDLEKQFDQTQEYVEVHDLEQLENASAPRKLAEYVQMEDTDKFVEEFEKLVQEELTNLTQNGFSVDKIALVSSVGYLFKSEYLENLKEQVKSADIDFRFDFSELFSNISLKYVPLSFYVFGNETFIDEIPVSEVDIGRRSILSQKKVSGIVDFNKFVRKIKELDYDIDFLNTPECNSMLDYINNTIEHQWENYILVSANLDKEKEEKNNKTK